MSEAGLSLGDGSVEAVDEPGDARRLLVRDKPDHASFIVPCQININEVQSLVIGKHGGAVMLAAATPCRLEAAVADVEGEDAVADPEVGSQGDVCKEVIAQVNVVASS